MQTESNINGIILLAYDEPLAVSWTWWNLTLLSGSQIFGTSAVDYQTTIK